MGNFHGALLDRHAAILDLCRPHPFMAAVADGSLPEPLFHRWLCQDHYWIRQFEGFLSRLAAGSPRSCQRAIFENVINAGGFRDVLEQMAAERGIDLNESGPNFATHAYIHFLLATVHVRTFEESLSACYAAHYVYLETWRSAGGNRRTRSPWQDFIDLRATESFVAWVEQLGRYLDDSAEGASQRLRNSMMQTFGMSLHYYIHCWDAALDGTDW